MTTERHATISPPSSWWIIPRQMDLGAVLGLRANSFTRSRSQNKTTAMWCFRLCREVGTPKRLVAWRNAEDGKALSVPTVPKYCLHIFLLASSSVARWNKYHYSFSSSTGVLDAHVRAVHFVSNIRKPNKHDQAHQVSILKYHNYWTTS